MRSTGRASILLALAALLTLLLVIVGAVVWDVFVFPPPPKPLLIPQFPSYGPPDVTTYTIVARYDPATFRISGTLTVTYRNVTSTPIPDVVLHLYLNAFQNEQTVWMQEAGPMHRGFAYDAQHPGSITLDAAHLVGYGPLNFTPVDADATLVRAELPEPVAPGESFTLVTAFTAQMPRVFARTGWAQNGDFLMAGQWFPKPGVWQDTGWNAYPFHANSEFFADFGSYEVWLTLPKRWVLVATGDKAAPPQRNADGSLTHHWVAQHVIDFAWAASPHLRVVERAYRDSNTPAPLTLRYAYIPASRAMVKRLIPVVEQALGVYERDFGLYGKGVYRTLTVLFVPPDAGGAGGMEYPMLFTVGALNGNEPACIHMGAVEAIHELAHQWWQSVVATNEAEEPWLDEGFTDYSTVHAMAELGLDGMDCGGWRFSYAAMRRVEYQQQPQVPMAGKAWDFDAMGYGIATYSKPAVALYTLEQVVGKEAMLSFMQAYFARHAFTHPRAEDVRALMAEMLGEAQAGAFFAQLVEGTGWMDAFVCRLDREMIELERAGEVCFPLQVELVNGQGRESFLWPCDRQSLTLRQPATPWREVIINSNPTLYVELNVANNGARLGVDWATWLSLAARWMYGLQNLNFWGGAAW